MKKVLLIEDNQEVRENTAEILELANYAVETAENGKTGVAKAQEYMPDIIICDIMMPELDGYGVLFLLSKNPKTAGIPFIFLTAKAEKSDIRKGMNLGADDYITKPFEEMELINTIESRLKRIVKLSPKTDDQVTNFKNFYDAVSSEKALSGLIQNRKLKTFAKKEMVYLEGNAPHSLYFLKSGQIKVIKQNEDGKKLITEIIKTGTFFGYQAMLEETFYHESVQTIENSEIVVIPKEDFYRLLLKNKDVSYYFIKLLSRNVIEKEEELINLAYNTVRKRVADNLIKLSSGNDDEITEIRVSREDLANMAGTSVESVIRMLSEFKSDKLIEINARKVTIRDMKALKALKY